MEKKICLLVICLCILCGCQSTPEEEIVVGKQGKELESAIRSIARNENELRPQEYQVSFQGGDEQVTIDVDAQIHDFYEQVPILRVVPHEITVEEVQKWAKVLFEGNTAYEPLREMSKEEIEKNILSIHQILNDEEALWANAATQDDYDYIKGYWEEQLAFFEKQYENASDMVQRKETDWIFHQGGYYDYQAELKEGNTVWENEIGKKRELVVETDIDGFTVELSATNRSEADYHIHNLWYIAPYEMYDQGEISMTEEEAIALGNSVIEAVGLDDWKLYSCEETSWNIDTVYYALKFSRFYNGIEITPLPQLDAIGNEEQYAAACYYESLEMHISNGRVCFVSWMQPMDVVSVENKNVQLLEFDEIMKRFQNMMQVTYISERINMGFSSEEEAQNAKYSIKIDEIKSGFMRIQVPNKDFEFYLMPAWSFYGTINNKISEHEAGSAFVESPLLMLNAVDGSNIDIQLGY